MPPVRLSPLPLFRGLECHLLPQVSPLALPSLSQSCLLLVQGLLCSSQVMKFLQLLLSLMAVGHIFRFECPEWCRINRFFFGGGGGGGMRLPIFGGLYSILKRNAICTICLNTLYCTSVWGSLTLPRQSHLKLCNACALKSWQTRELKKSIWKRSFVILHLSKKPKKQGEIMLSLPMLSLPYIPHIFLSAQHHLARPVGTHLRIVWPCTGNWAKWIWASFC